MKITRIYKLTSKMGTMSVIAKSQSQAKSKYVQIIKYELNENISVEEVKFLTMTIAHY